MDEALGYGDDSLWKGLACPPLDEEFAFNFDDTCYKLDCILDDPLLEGEIEEECSITTNVRTNEVDGINKRTNKSGVMKNKSNHCYGNFGKGKELKLNLNMEEIKAFLEEEIEEVVEEIEEVEEKKDKDVKRVDHTNPLCVVDNKKRKAVSDVRLEVSRHMNELVVAEKMRQADYDLKFEATTHKLHEINEKLREVKQQKKIQVIEFKKLVMEQPRCTAKPKGKSSLRQRLMAMGTCKNNKKFHPFVY